MTVNDLRLGDAEAVCTVLTGVTLITLVALVTLVALRAVRADYAAEVLRRSVRIGNDEFPVADCKDCTLLTSLEQPANRKAAPITMQTVKRSISTFATKCLIL